MNISQEITNVILFIYAGGIGILLIMIINNSERILQIEIDILKREIEQLTGKEL